MVLILFSQAISILCVVKGKDPYRVKKKDEILRAPQFDYQSNWIFLDGSSQGSNSMSGVGMMIYLSHTKYCKLKLWLGASTNSQAELLGLWGLLKFVNLIQVNNIQIVGDWKLIIDWFNGNCHM